MYLRAWFQSTDNQFSEITPIEGVWCHDFFKDEIAEEQLIGGDMWYTNTFQQDAQSKWICPNITDIELLKTDKTL